MTMMSRAIIPSTITAFLSTCTHPQGKKKRCTSNIIEVQFECQKKDKALKNME